MYDRGSWQLHLCFFRCLLVSTTKGVSPFHPFTGQVSERVTTESIEGPFQLNPGEEAHFCGDLGYRRCTR